MITIGFKIPRLEVIGDVGTPGLVPVLVGKGVGKASSFLGASFCLPHSLSPPAGQLTWARRAD